MLCEFELVSVLLLLDVGFVVAGVLLWLDPLACTEQVYLVYDRLR